MADRPTLNETVLARLVDALDDERVIVDPAAVDEFKDPYYIPGDDTFTASAVVEPTSTEEVQAVMRIATEFGVPVWPHSQGRNYGYGGPSPVVRGSLQISLKKMNRVLEINEELAYAVVEPGVRWFDLYDAIEAGGHSLMLSVPDLGWGSVIGNSMDNGMTYQPYGADFQILCGLEVVLPDGSLVRTGMGAIPDNKAWHLYRRGLGPVIEPLFAQSNYGIVVSAGVWLKRKPAGYMTLGLTLAKDADLEAGVDAIRELRLEGILEGVPSIYTILTAAPQLIDADIDGPALMTEEQIQEIADRTGLGRWATRAALWGPTKIVEYKLERVKEVWEAIPGATVIHSPLYTPEDYKGLTNSSDQIHAGIPTLQLIEATPPNMGHIGFSPIVPLQGREVRFVVDEMRKRVEEAGLNFLGGVMAFNERSACVVGGIPFDVTDREQAERAFNAVRRLVKEVGALGYGEYRAHIDYMDEAQAVYNWNDGAYRRFAETLKDAIDPKGILSPGRHGIWPKQYREGDAADAR
ncbi:FAD-binding oxidoreductase [Microbacterium sp. UBA3394]|uniref:FAD-binding oxidoreductase n=1 Tax=Microbacterium sp. UBA3394 TaxID=1946945 RepID=UPI00257EC08C|nr:FAD-binding oxidoreductase [Microbacterium sp. UBA3394]|tara:strand:- start:7221 stop:8783 length:1563 start_codon:yes stop_codon:yes gene_type:complete